MTLSKKLLGFQKKYGFKVSQEFKDLEEHAKAIGQARLLSSALPDADSIWPEASTGQVDAISSYKHIASIEREAGLVQDIAGADADGEMHFWHCSFLQHAYPIAQTYGGDPIVQIAQGKHAGEIYFANHECWYGAPQAIAAGDEEGIEECMLDIEDVLEELGIESVNNLKTDCWVALFSNENLDFMFKLADTFQDFYRYLAGGEGKEEEA